MIGDHHIRKVVHELPEAGQHSQLCWYPQGLLHMNRRNISHGASTWLTKHLRHLYYSVIKFALVGISITAIIKCS
jgi:hypothetical protein